MFEGIIGNNQIKNELAKTITNHNISHSYMFVGKSGIGKKLFAREFAKGLLLETDTNSNKDIENFEDYNEISPLEGKKIISIDQIRELIQKASELPTASKHRVFVIDEADKMNVEAQNAILKTLEEPPDYVIIILVVQNENMMLETIKSRVTKYKFEDLKNSEIEEFLNLHPEFSTNNEKNVEIKLLNGSLENIENINDSIEKYTKLKTLATFIKNKDIIGAFNSSQLLYDGKDDIMNLLNLLNIIFLDDGLTKCVFIVEKTKQKINMNNNYTMCIDNLIMRSIDSI